MDTPFHTGGEAHIHYGTPDFTMLTPGSYVLCAVTGERIPINNLRYWSVERQEAYVDAAAALKAYLDGGRVM